MKKDTETLSDIKSKSWHEKNKIKGDKLSSYKMLASITPVKDWFGIAKKCSENQLKPEYYGREIQDIINEWNLKGKVAANRGNELDRYIESTLNSSVKAEVVGDETLTKIYNNFYDLYESKLKHLEYVGSEIWVNESSQNLIGRIDTIFMFNNKGSRYLLLVDWKSTETIDTSNGFECYDGPAKHLDVCKLNDFTFQLYFYTYILRKYKYENILPKIIQINSIIPAKIINPGFKYSDEYMESVFEYAHSFYKK